MAVQPKIVHSKPRQTFDQSRVREALKQQTGQSERAMGMLLDSLRDLDQRIAELEARKCSCSN